MGQNTRIKRILILIPICFVLLVYLMQRSPLPARGSIDGFVDMKSFIPLIQLDIRYHTKDNFVGDPIEGYVSPLCLLTREAAEALLKVQRELLQQNYSLKLYDCYRPQQAVDHFVRWAADLSDTRMQDRYYPHVEKSQLFAQGYIASRSSHSRGSAVDLTLVKLTPETDPLELTAVDMGSEFDFFDPISHTLSDQITVDQRASRIRLKTAMERQGFQNYAREWWHYTLIREPYPHTYFNFPLSSAG